jgi:hypothetical protein
VEQARIDLYDLREEHSEVERRVGALIGRLRP